MDLYSRHVVGPIDKVNALGLSAQPLQHRMFSINGQSATGGISVQYSYRGVKESALHPWT